MLWAALVRSALFVLSAIGGPKPTGPDDPVASAPNNIVCTGLKGRKIRMNMRAARSAPFAGVWRASACGHWLRCRRIM